MDAKLALSCVLIVGGAVGLAMPVLRAEEELTSGSGSASNASLTIGAVRDAQAGEWASDLELERADDGHFYADVTIDGVTTRMLVDTGASVVALTGEDALAAGLTWEESEITKVAEGASGAVHGVRTRLPHVRLGDFEAENVDAIIVPQGLGVSLLGQSFLETVGHVAIEDDRMVLDGAAQ